MIVDLFAGPGGWDEGLRMLGVDDVIGIEWDAAACDTAAAAGHLRAQADVATYPTAPFVGYRGLIASPPCQAFSLAGKGLGRAAVDRLLEHVWTCRDGWVEPPSDICGEDVRADLTLQPLRWVDAIRPEWVALEQVPPVLPLWRAVAAVFELWGYTTAVAVLNAADFGVPQTRRRAVLVASRVDVARLPEATHFDPRKGGSLFGDPWVSMAEALITGAGNTYMWSRPAPTVTSGHCSPFANADIREKLDDYAVVTVTDAGVLQSFPADYPWRGTKGKQYQQVGNAVPPKLAAAILAPLVQSQAKAA